MLWLFVFGMVHAYFLWWGDILVTYALAGLVIFPFRKLGIRLQLGIGVVKTVSECLEILTHIDSPAPQSTGVVGRVLRLLGRKEPTTV